jgi:hypothetical protein
MHFTGLFGATSHERAGWGIIQNYEMSHRIPAPESDHAHTRLVARFLRETVIQCEGACSSFGIYSEAPLGIYSDALTASELHALALKHRAMAATASTPDIDLM